MDDVEDSEEEVANRAGSGRRGAPRKDNKFEERLEDIRRLIRRQKVLLASIEEKYEAVFPEAVHEGDPGGCLRVLCYGTDDKLTGMQVIAFRQVITACLADIVTRTTANTADGANVTVVQIEAAAVAAIKQKIDDGDYDDLPQTLEKGPPTRDAGWSFCLVHFSFFSISVYRFLLRFHFFLFSFFFKSILISVLL